MLSHFCSVQLFTTPWTVVHQASLSFTISWSLFKLTSNELVMPSNHLILCLLLSSLAFSLSQHQGLFAVSRVFASGGQSWSFSFSISPSNEYSGLISFRMDCLDLLQSKGLSRVFSNTTVQKHQFFGARLSSQSNSHIHT